MTETFFSFGLVMEGWTRIQNRFRVGPLVRQNQAMGKARRDILDLMPVPVPDSA